MAKEASGQLTVTVKAYGHLRRFMPEARESTEVKLQAGSTVADLLAVVGIPGNEVWLVSIDDEVVEEDYQVDDGDLVLVMAPVEGG